MLDHQLGLIGAARAEFSANALGMNTLNAQHKKAHGIGFLPPSNTLGGMVNEAIIAVNATCHFCLKGICYKH
jgi:hypothetical protein